MDSFSHSYVGLLEFKMKELLILFTFLGYLIGWFIVVQALIRIKSQEMEITDNNTKECLSPLEVRALFDKENESEPLRAFNCFLRQLREKNWQVDDPFRAGWIVKSDDRGKQVAWSLSGLSIFHHRLKEVGWSISDKLETKYPDGSIAYWYVYSNANREMKDEEAELPQSA